MTQPNDSYTEPALRAVEHAARALRIVSSTINRLTEAAVPVPSAFDEAEADLRAAMEKLNAVRR